MIDENIRKLQKEFKKIKGMEYIKTVRNGPTGVGATFEKLIGKETYQWEFYILCGTPIKHHPI